MASITPLLTTRRTASPCVGESFVAYLESTPSSLPSSLFPDCCTRACNSIPGLVLETVTSILENVRNIVTILNHQSLASRCRRAPIAVPPRFHRAAAALPSRCRRASIALYCQSKKIQVWV